MVNRIITIEKTPPTLMDQIITISKQEKGEKVSLNTLDCTRIKLHLSPTLKGIDGSPRWDAPGTRIFSKKVIVKLA